MQSRKNASSFTLTTYYFTVVLSAACLLSTGCAGWVERHQAEQQRQAMVYLKQALEQQNAKAQAEHDAQREALAKYCKCNPDEHQGEGFAKWIIAIGFVGAVMSAGPTPSTESPTSFTPSYIWNSHVERRMTTQENDRLPAELQQ